jgi:hypothetical protein
MLGAGQGDYYGISENTDKGDLQSQVESAGYDYNKLKAEYSDDEIRAAIGK